jgi:beta-N-acetylhexosaminidase
LCALKHFPGHGRSRADSHSGFVDISRAWGEDELEPFRALIRAGLADIVMSGHLTHARLSGGQPMTFSGEAIQGVLRKRLGFAGAAMTDDLDMAAIRDSTGLREACVRAIAAGHDLVMMSNSARYDPDLAPKAARWIADAVAAGRFPASRVERAHARIRALKGRVG